MRLTVRSKLRSSALDFRSLASRTSPPPRAAAACARTHARALLRLRTSSSQPASVFVYSRRNQLIGKCARAGKRFDDALISPVIRQSLLHWGYELTQKDADAYVKLKGLPTLPR